MGEPWNECSWPRAWKLLARNNGRSSLYRGRCLGGVRKVGAARACIRGYGHPGAEMRKGWSTESEDSALTACVGEAPPTDLPPVVVPASMLVPGLEAG